jgi:hypothetical protein
MRAFALVAVVMALAACAKKDAAPDTTAATSPAPVAPAMAVRITSPADGDTVGADVAITLSAQGVTIEKATGIRVEGVGHFHLFLDAPPSADNLVIPPNSPTIVHIGTGDSTYSYKNLPAGAHEVIAVIGYGDHTPMATQRDTVRFVVKR